MGQSGPANAPVPPLRVIARVAVFAGLEKNRILPAGLAALENLPDIHIIRGFSLWSFLGTALAVKHAVSRRDKPDQRSTGRRLGLGDFAGEGRIDHRIHDLI